MPLEKEMDNVSRDLAERFGVNLAGERFSESELFNKGRESLLLGKAIAVAKEAKEMEFEKDLPVI